MNQKLIKSRRDRLFDSELDFIDELGEAFTPPEFVEIPKPRSMLEARMEIILDIRNHFRKALAELGLREDTSSSNKRRNG